MMLSSPQVQYPRCSFPPAPAELYNCTPHRLHVFTRLCWRCQNAMAAPRMATALLNVTAYLCNQLASATGVRGLWSLTLQPRVVALLKDPAVVIDGCWKIGRTNATAALARHIGAML